MATKHGRYFSNPYIDDPHDFLRLRTQVFNHPDELIDIYLSRAVKLLQACAENAMRLLSVACGPPSHSRDTYRLGSKLYNGELAGFGYALQRLAQTLAMIRADLVPSAMLSSTIAAIADLQCGFRLKRQRDGHRSLEIADDVRPAPTTIAQAVHHCQAIATNILSLCVGCCDRPERDALPLLRTFLESDLGTRAVLHRLMLPAYEERPSQIANEPLEADLAGAIDAVAKVAVDADVDAYADLLYGRAGVLYTLLYLVQRCHDYGRARAAADLARRILTSGAQAARRRESPLPLHFEWHGADYLGAAHGLAGVLFVLLQVETQDDDLRRQIEAAARRAADVMIVSLQLPSGNFPTRLGGDLDDRLLQWCHGAPGVLALLCRVRQLGDDDGRLGAAIDRALDDVWTRGLLRKGVGLCHGIGGNGYAFLRDPGSGFDRHLMLVKAAAFAEVAWAKIDDLFARPDNPFSLFEGVAGLVCFQLDVVLALANKPVLGMPGFEI